MPPASGRTPGAGRDRVKFLLLPPKTLGLKGQGITEVGVGDFYHGFYPVSDFLEFEVGHAIFSDDIFHLGTGTGDDGSGRHKGYDAGSEFAFLIAPAGIQGDDALASIRHLGSLQEIQLSAGSAVLPMTDGFGADLSGKVHTESVIH